MSDASVPVNINADLELFDVKHSETPHIEPASYSDIEVSRFDGGLTPVRRARSPLEEPSTSKFAGKGFRKGDSPDFFGLTKEVSKAKEMGTGSFIVRKDKPLVEVE